MFEDAGYSAKNTERPAYQKMMARIRAGEFSHLVVWKIDRISRNLVDFAAMYDEIKGVGLQEIFDTLRRRKFPDTPYKPGTDDTDAHRADGKTPQEMDLPVSEKRRLERAQARLQSLTLYGDEGISEKDYLIERKRIAGDISNIDARINTIEKDRTSNIIMTDKEFIEKASYFIMAHSLIEKREVNYEKVVKEIDPRIVRNLLTSIVTNICIKDGHVESIRFKNGMEHRFLYKGDVT